MKVKLLEVRDKATFIPMLCIEVGKFDNEEQRYLAARVGFAETNINIIMTRLSGEGKSSADPYFWGDRTFTVSHDYIINNWNSLKDGDVIDVEFILGETQTKKISERIEFKW